jgi:mRNA-degrading endonuclease RelE of RelBE toxin-antitoxin system
MHNIQISEHMQQVLRKISEIVNSQDLDRYKNLRYNMKDSKRSHIGHFVLVFQYDKKTDNVNFDDFDHHDNIYKKR